MSKILKISAVSAATLVALYAVGGYVVVPSVVKSVISDQSEQVLGRTAQIGDVTFNPWTWTLQVSDVTVPGKTEPLLKLKQATVDVSAATLKGAPVVESLSVDGLHVVASLQPENVSRAGDNAQASVGADDGEPLAFALHNVTVNNSSIRVVDMTRGIDQRITDINVALPFFSTMQDDATVTMTPSLSMKINGTPVVARGEADSQSARLHLTVAQLDIAQFTHLIPSIKQMGISVDRAKLTTDLKLYFKNPTDGADTQLTVAGHVKVGEFSAREKFGNQWVPLASANELSMNIKSVNLMARSADISSVTVLNPVVNVRRTAPVPAQQGATSASAGSDSDAGWDWTLARVAVQNGTVSWLDTSVTPQASLKARSVNVGVQGLSSNAKAEPARISVSARVAGGSVAVNGTATIGGDMKLNLQTQAQSISLPSINTLMQAYANGIGADSGVFNAQGALSMQNNVFGWEGQMALKDLDLTRQGAKFMHWQNASVMGLAVKTTDPLTLKINELNVEQPGTVQTQAVKQVSQWVGALAALSGHDRTAERMQKVDEKLSKNIVIRDIRYENGELSAQGVSKESVAGALLDKLAQTLGAKTFEQDTAAQ